MSAHAIVHVGNYSIPLIGIPVDATLERCDECGKFFNVRQITLEDGKFICEKCRQAKRP